MTRNFIKCGIVLLFFSLTQRIHSTRLSEFINYYEPLSYDKFEVAQSHSRVRRWTTQSPESRKNSEEPTVSIQFSSHSKHFHLRLKRDTATFGDHFTLEMGNDLDHWTENTHLFEGYVNDIPNSKVYGAIRNGIFDGRIQLLNETFYVEKLSKFPHVLNDTSIHSVIYSERDLEHNLEKKHSKTCGLKDDKVVNWMENIQNSKINNAKHSKDEEFYSYFQNPKSTSEFTYSLARDLSKRHRRQAKRNQRTTCSLKIRTDPLLWRQFAIDEARRGNAGDKSAIAEEILSLVGQHVKAANEIFANTLFNGTIAHKNIQFLVRRVKIETDEECDENYTGPENPFCAENIDVSNYLDLHSRTKVDDFCLSYAFTYRDFSGGVVGLAWVASPEISGAAGGICEKYSGDNGFASPRSLNTGIVTFLNYNRRLPPKISHLTFTHELGHNFGAPHDPEGNECRPGGKHGNFLMYSSATNGYLGNNDKFSSCSIASISAVLDKVVIGTGKTKNCFEDTQSAFCGNQIVEEGEECDCGYNIAECIERNDQCCMPKTSDEDGNAFLEGACKRKRGVECSPSEGPCCDSNCGFAPNVNHQLKRCSPDSECTESSFCDGRSAQCPTPIPKPSNTTLCNNGTQVCIEGECRGSICIKYGFEECSLTHEEEPNKSILCNIACLNPANGKCESLKSQVGIEISNSKSFKLRPGNPCDNFRGYCDVFQKCRLVDERGPLLRLYKILLNKGTYKNVIEWIKGNPWWSGLIGLGFCLLFAVSKSHVIKEYQLV